MSNRQTEIKNWFNKIYKTRGFKYLRPLPAYNIFAAILAPKKGQKHLDVACGLGLMLRSMQEKGANVYGIDISEEAIKQAKLYCPKALLAVGNAEELPYPDHFFDSITCIGSLERMIDRQSALDEQIRVAKKQARFCFMVRNSENFTWKYILKPFGLKNSESHQDAMNLEQWCTLFTSAGFKIEHIYPDHWPYYRILKIIKPWRNINTGRIVKFPFKLSLAYEFIFLMRKDE